TALGGSGPGSGSPFDAFAVTPFTLAFTPGSTDFNKLVVPPPPVFDSRPPDAGELEVRRSVRVDTVDTTAPAAPVLDLVASDDTRSSSSDNLTNKASVHISVAAEDGARVDLSDGQSAIASGGSVTFTVSLAAGDNTFTATATDAAGNTSPAGSLTIRRDSTPPSAPVLDLVASDDTGSSIGRALTNKRSVQRCVATEDRARVA